MHRKLYLFHLLLLMLSSDVALGKDDNESNKTKIARGTHRNHNNIKEKINNERIKRSYDDENDENPFWPNRGKKEFYVNSNYGIENIAGSGKNPNFYTDVNSEPPFWGTRGRRDSSSVENDVNEYFAIPKNSKHLIKYCKHCSEESSKDRRDEQTSPFWGNRGRRNSEEFEHDQLPPFWGNRGRRQENDPFWGTRGRRDDDEPFWGNRGKKEYSPFWDNRGRRDEVEPFWGNRGRREESEPFWGNRGRREESEPFWGNRGRRYNLNNAKSNSYQRKEEYEPFSGNRGRKKESLRESILYNINNVENDIEKLSRLRRTSHDSPSFWSNRGRDSSLKYLFNTPSRLRLQYSNSIGEPLDYGRNSRSEPSTVHDDRIFAEEPHYIIVERSSRSSAEDDPYYISRGKKKFINYQLYKAARDRRGTLEKIVKSVRNDPFYIARGKKDIDNNRTGIRNITHNDVVKAKELICATMNLIMTKDGQKSKRQIDDNDRDRRTILKKLAAQLQMDPYFVSRGKKGEVTFNDDELEDFINQIAEFCN